MIALALLRQFWPVLVVLGLGVGGWIAYQTHGTARYKAGKAEVMAEWRESDRVAVAVGAAKTELLVRDAVRNREKLIEIQTENAKRAAVGAAALADRGRTIDELRLALAKPPAPSTSSNPACPSSGVDEADYRRCRSVLSSGLALAAESDKLVESGERLLKTSEARLTAIQDWAGLVQSVK
jgi:hypothetical protein